MRLMLATALLAFSLAPASAAFVQQSKSDHVRELRYVLTQMPAYTALSPKDRRSVVEYAAAWYLVHPCRETIRDKLMSVYGGSLTAFAPEKQGPRFQVYLALIGYFVSVSPDERNPELCDVARDIVGQDVPF